MLRTPEISTIQIQECRSSGLTDYQWRQEHDINPGTLCNRVKRHRQKTCAAIPGTEERKQCTVSVLWNAEGAATGSGIQLHLRMNGSEEY